MSKEHIGGQAVIEGVMFMGKNKLAIAARDPEGKIEIKKDKLRELGKFWKLPILRGVINLVRMLVVGYKALEWSADIASKEDGEIKKSKMDGVLMYGALLIALVVGVGLFILLPLWLTGFVLEKGVLFNILDGVIRIVIFVAYLLIISQMKDVKRIFQYHGAEHKVVNCYEADENITVENVKKYSTAHNRCGTSFLIIVLVLSIIIFSFITSSEWIIKFLSRILLIPVIAGLGYEIIKLGDKYKKNFLFRILIKPGLWVQGMTTREPSSDQIEVAIKAFEAVKE